MASANTYSLANSPHDLKTIGARCAQQRNCKEGAHHFSQLVRRRLLRASPNTGVSCGGRHDKQGRISMYPVLASYPCGLRVGVVEVPTWSPTNVETPSMRPYSPHDGAVEEARGSRGACRTLIKTASSWWPGRQQLAL